MCVGYIPTLLQKIEEASFIFQSQNVAFSDYARPAILLASLAQPATRLAPLATQCPPTQIASEAA